MHWLFLGKTEQDFQTATAAYQRAGLPTDRRWAITISKEAPFLSQPIANKLAKNADSLICESTYSSKFEDKGEKYNHMTSKQAAQIANQANVKKLVLTHFSARYKNTQEIEEDARTYFNEVVCAKDFMKINL